MMGDIVRSYAVMWTPRAGCSVAWIAFLDGLGIKDTALSFSEKHFVHDFRTHFFERHAPKIDQRRIAGRLRIVKVVMNPYARAVSIWNHLHHDMDAYGHLSFRAYLRARINGTFKGSARETNHAVEQYIDGEERYVTDYVRIDFDEHVDVGGFRYQPSRYKSVHHTKRNSDINYFVGDIPLQTLKKMGLPASYRWMYDKDIQCMVEKLYARDIAAYKYNFDDPM